MVTELKERLKVLQNKMGVIKEKYKKQIDIMESATFMSNYINPLRGRYGEFSQIIKTIQSMIEEHKMQIALHEEALENLIEDARG
jgi:archaellum component FlaC